MTRVRKKATSRRWRDGCPRAAEKEIAFRTARVILQDFTGVPAVVDLAAMRDAMTALGGDPKLINPLQPVDLVIDHSVQVDEYGTDAAFLLNTNLEFERNVERYVFLRWGQDAFKNFRVVPPGTGICHQVNLEYLGKTVFVNEETNEAYCDLSRPGSHTTIINGLGFSMGRRRRGRIADAVQPVSMLIPRWWGFNCIGKCLRPTRRLADGHGDARRIRSSAVRRVLQRAECAEPRRSRDDRQQAPE